MPHFRLVRVTDVGGQMAEISVVYGDERYDRNHAHQYVANVMRTRAEGEAQPFTDEEAYDYFETTLRSAHSEPTPTVEPTARKVSLISRFLRRNRT